MTAYTYALSEFTSLVADIGHVALSEEVAAAIPGVPLYPRRTGARFIDDLADPTYRLDFNGTLSGAEETLLDGVVANHVGPAGPSASGGATYALEHRWFHNTGSLVYIPTQYSVAEHSGTGGSKLARSVSEREPADHASGSTITHESCHDRDRGRRHGSSDARATR